MKTLRFLLPFLIAACGLRAQSTVLIGNANVSGNMDFTSGANLSLASGTTMNFGIAGTTNSLLYLTNSSGNVGALGLGSGLSVSGGNLIAASSTSANPTGLVGTSAVNGSASSFLRSDGAPALNLTIAPTWTGEHLFQPTSAITTGSDYGTLIEPILNQRNATNFSALIINEWITQAGTGNQYLIEGATSNGSGGSKTDVFALDNTGGVDLGTWKATAVGPTYGGTGLTSAVKGATLTASAANTWSALAPGAINTVYTSGGSSALTSWQPLTTILDAIGTPAQGDILYRGGSTWALLAPGTSGQLLSTQGAGANPQWVSAVTAPGTTTTHDVVSYSNSTGGLEDTAFLNLGGTVSNTVTAITTNSTNNGTLSVQNLSNASSDTAASILTPNLPTGASDFAWLRLGTALSNDNSVAMGFVNSGGPGSSSNYVAWEFYGGSIVMSLAQTGALTIAGKMASYNGVATAGIGVTPVVSTPRSTGQTGTVSLTAYTAPGADSSYEVSDNVNITTYSSGTFTVTCTYTDEGNTSRTLTLTHSNIAGTLATACAAAGAFEGVPLHIRCKASTTITFATTGTFTSLTYNVEGTVIQLQ